MVQIKSCCDNGNYSISDSNFWKHSSNTIDVCSCSGNASVTSGSGTVTLIGDCATDCSCFSIEIDQLDIVESGGEARVYYQCCDGSFQYEVYTSGGSYTLCAQYIFHIMMYKAGVFSLPQYNTYFNGSADNNCNCSACAAICG
jgi:hypothetical protein